ncbi:MAG: hypothetical protein NT051_02745, partial [Candidatus Micrarchaeota archaeon]|nr:hypothetical protein [Candidatus Micrarchaeota archaeon]
ELVYFGSKNGYKSKTLEIDGYASFEESFIIVKESAAYKPKWDNFPSATKVSLVCEANKSPEKKALEVSKKYGVSFESALSAILTQNKIDGLLATTKVKKDSTFMIDVPVKGEF